MANFLEGSNGSPNDRNLPGPIEYLLDSYGLCVPSINDTLVVLDWDKDTLVIENGPILLDDHVDLITYCGFQMGKIKILLQLHTMFELVISTQKLGIHLIQ
jgi:hypothetical protein